MRGVVEGEREHAGAEGGAGLFGVAVCGRLEELLEGMAGGKDQYAQTLTELSDDRQAGAVDAESGMSMRRIWFSSARVQGVMAKRARW